MLTHNQQLGAAIVAGASLVVLVHWLTPLNLFASWVLVLAGVMVAEAIWGRK
jgi:hypothetical protein